MHRRTAMRRRTLLRATAGAVALGGLGTASGQETTTADDGGGFDLTASAWENGAAIPTEYTCEGENVSPSLAISDPPEGTESLALVMDDPDAPNPPFVHWLLWDVPPDATEIPRDVSASETVEALGGAAQGTNGTGELGYVGPCPPEGDPRHTYLFSLFALEESLDLGPGAEYDEVLSALFPRALARARYVGQYERG